jgi:hypothetical protein
MQRKLDASCNRRDKQKLASLQELFLSFLFADVASVTSGTVGP